MKQLNFTQTAPLNLDSEGTIRLTGSRITFDTLMAAFKKGNTAEQIQDSFPSLSLAQIYGAIAWYFDHQAEAEDYLKEREAEAEVIRQEIENQPGASCFPRNDAPTTRTTTYVRYALACRSTSISTPLEVELERIRRSTPAHCRLKTYALESVDIQTPDWSN
jgi:uncharacterized protein (DUF433 family)